MLVIVRPRVHTNGLKRRGPMLDLVANIEDAYVTFSSCASSSRVRSMRRRDSSEEGKASSTHPLAALPCDLLISLCSQLRYAAKIPSISLEPPTIIDAFAGRGERRLAASCSCARRPGSQLEATRPERQRAQARAAWVFPAGVFVTWTLEHATVFFSKRVGSGGRAAIAG